MALAETECIPASPGSCKILIIIHIAFSYNDSEISQNQIDAWVQDIKDTWNGPDGQRLYGDCQCAVEFQVDAMKVTDPAQINCNPGPPGYHCVMITDDAKNPPKNTNGTKTYRGYMYNVSDNGSSVNGWWSDAMNAPAYAGGGPASDAGHEAGHMLGLPDDYDKGPPERYGNNIMGRTTGDYAYPTQDQINSVVEMNCGEDACPDECCCGNGEVDKSEACDPMSIPTACGAGAYCCPYCCQCHYGGCVPGNGSYATDGDCKQDCKDGDCMYNYETKCWDCVKRQPPVITPGPKTAPQIIREIISGIISWVSRLIAPEIAGPEPAAADAGEFVLWSNNPNAPQPAEGCGDGACGEGESCSTCGDCECDAGEYCNPWYEESDESGCAQFSCPELYVYKPEKPPADAPDDCGLVMSWGDRCSPGYSSQSACEPNCKPEGNVWKDCLLNYVTDCWDCVSYAGRQGGFVCGDRACSATENCSSCPGDCGPCPPRCGDLRCDIGEKCTCAECACGEKQYCDPKGSNPDRKGCINSRCGDRRCTGGETCSNCERDCGPCPAVCGNRKCETGENCSTCAGDCGVCPTCGNDRCEGDEDCDSCDDDCECDDDEVCDPENGNANYEGCVKKGCGDGVCDLPAGEDCECEDCDGVCPVGTECAPGESGADPLGCRVLAGPCGNGLCDETEYCYTCPQDCKCTAPECCHPAHGGIGCGTVSCDPVDLP